MITKVAIQGIKGAFHEEAAVKYYKNKKIEIVPCVTFSELTEAVENGKADTGIMAVENTIAGSILPNYSLIENSDLRITGEIYIRIVQNLIGNTENINNIKEVYSHPMALYQCGSFFKNHPGIRLIESFDTAISAKHIADSGEKNTAAVASSFAAKRYNLKIIAKNIEDNKLNYTRFFELKRKPDKKPEKINKASVCFTLSNKKGSLASILSVLAYYEINLHKIQSHPIIGKPWKYSFYADLVFDSKKKYKQAKKAVIPLTTNFKVLGEYKESNKSLTKLHKTIKNKIS
ncbi:MAG: prephenate dehydratase [Chlorobi bacterium]|nr:prephenate dehydratase [Chlorobiota bacterium]